MIDGYYNRFDASKEYESHLFRAGYVLQSAELNEMQYSANNRVRGIADVLFRDGDIVRDARIIVNPLTGVTTCESGAVYLQGAVRGVGTATLTIPVIGIVAVGLYVQSSVVTEIDDPALRDPATLVRNYNEAGAARHKLHVAWGFSGDVQTGEFFPVYTVEDGAVRAKEPPPNLDAVTQALARYDRDSAGGTYVVTGLGVKALDDLVSGEQVYSVAEGRARVNGYGVDLTTSRRLVYPAAPDLLFINSEPHVSTGTAAHRVDFDRVPSAGITEVNITAQKTVSLTHGGFTGAQDPLPDTGVLQILSVVQGGTTYVQNTDYKLTAGKVDWSLAGAEVATGSTYNVTYQYITAATPTLVDETGFTIADAVAGTLVLVSYNQRLPRYDRLTLSAEGVLAWVRGVAAEWNPVPPSVPPDLLSLAVVYQSWGSVRDVTNDSVRVVPMSELSAINGRIDYMLGLIAQQRLEGDINLREAGQKQGLFVDPFLDDLQRDQGAAQTAAIFSGELNLPVTIDDVSQLPSDVAARTSLAFGLSLLLEQNARTGVMKVNPYMAFDPIPASVTLTPAVDNWTVVNTSWASQITQRVSVGWGNAARTSTSVSSQLLSSASRASESLRPIEVRFSLSGFGANEELSSVTFDGVPVTATAI
jgi:hypothetical protein